MKGFALVLLCIVAAVQGRSTGVQTNNRELAVLGENPWLVHLRLAIATSGFLNTCAGSLINQAWVLTTANCVHDTRFIWIRYGVVTVINPELVTEASSLRVHPEADVALISINRIIQSTANIAPTALSRDAAVPESATFCGFGEENGAPGEVLSCFAVILEESDDVIVAQSDDGETSRFDIGAPLVSDGVQFGILSTWADGENAGTFLKAGDYIPWIEAETGLSL